MKTEKRFLSANRYRFDFGMCSSKNGFAQIDTSQDASYFGTWANPFELKIISYIEGDIIIQSAESVDEFVTEIRKIKEWNERYGWRFLGIDPGCNADIEEKFKAIGLGDFLH